MTSHCQSNKEYSLRYLSWVIDGTSDLLSVTFECGNNLSRLFVKHYSILICTTCNERGNKGVGRGGERE